MAAGMDARAVITNKATITAATARTTKLYGQMIPNTKSGDCHDGALIMCEMGELSEAHVKHQRRGPWLGKTW